MHLELDKNRDLLEEARVRPGLVVGRRLLTSRRVS